jgi:hypothetical protein
MHPVLLRVSLVTLLAPVLFSSGAAFAAKAKFERSKPHLNVGTIGHQGVSILITNLRGNGDSSTPCAFSGELLATDHTPDRLVREEVLRVSVALAEGESLSIPIPYPFDGSPDGLRREVSVEINPDETSERCSIAAAVVGYDSDFQGTQYASHHRVTKIDRFVIRQPIAPASFVGFAGGNAHQVARVVFTRFDPTDEELSQGRQCEYSGALLVQGVPILDSDPNEAASRAYPVKFTGPRFQVGRRPVCRIGRNRRHAGGSRAELCRGFRPAGPMCHLARHRCAGCRSGYRCNAVQSKHPDPGPHAGVERPERGRSGLGSFPRQRRQPRLHLT